MSAAADVLEVVRQVQRLGLSRAGATASTLRRSPGSGLDAALRQR